jgi:hypothetical protein
MFQKQRTSGRFLASEIFCVLNAELRIRVLDCMEKKHSKFTRFANIALETEGNGGYVSVITPSQQSTVTSF